MKADKLPKLRQQLSSTLAALKGLLGPAFDSTPILPGAVHVSRHRCGKPQCRCVTEKKLHESVRLQIRFQDGLTNRALTVEEVAFFTPRAEAYRRLRQAGRALRKWEKEVHQILESIEQERRSTEGLSDEDQKRPLR